MRIKQLVQLVTDAAGGKDNFKEGAVGSNGYSFVFKDSKSQIPYITGLYSQKYCEAGSMRDVMKIWKKVKNFKDLKDLSNFDEMKDLLLAGSLKTLLPNLQFGGFSMFKVWMLVKTPEEYLFPTTFYWGVSGPTIGGWTSYDIDPITKERIFPEEFVEVINFNPFKFTDDERGCLLDALEFALKKVPVSDFWGVFNRDIGNHYMGVRRGESFMKELGDFERDPGAEKKLEPLIGKEFIDVYDESFSIKSLPGMRIYAAQFEYDVENDDIYFGNAKELLELYNKRIKKN